MFSFFTTEKNTNRSSKHTLNYITNRTKKNRKNRKTKKINCSPMVSGKTVHSNTCFTPALLYKIKEEYNKDYPNDPIKETNPNDIWNALHKKLTTCSKEDCWLTIIDNVKLRNQVDEYIFAPDHPPSWLDNPNEWLSNVDIEKVMYQYEKTYATFRFIGPSFIDFDIVLKQKKCVTNELCHFSLAENISNKKMKIGVIFNLDKHTGPGTHWVSLFIDIQDHFLFYFDSAGAIIPTEIKMLVNRIIEQGKQLEKPISFQFIENYPLQHQMSNTECGMYSLFFIITMLTNQFKHRKFSNKQQKIDFFKKKRIPDTYIEKFRKIYFND
jgi:hypothetical protein